MKPFLTCTFLILCTAFLAAQPVYFHQTFSGSGSFVNPEPDTGQFSHMILTAPALSYHKFHKGYMELVRTLQDSATGGIIRAMRATPFMPVPDALMIRVTLSAEQIQSVSPNAIYFYVGEHFNPVNNAFPGNDLMFGKVSLHFLSNSFVIKDHQTQAFSKQIPSKTPVTLTWVLNNSGEVVAYELPESRQAYSALPGTYDLWVDSSLVGRGIPAYPMHSPFSATKLSNFEMRFRNGVGKVRIYEILIKGMHSRRAADRAWVAPNPSPHNRIELQAGSMREKTLQLTRQNGQQVACSTTWQNSGTLIISPHQPLVPGIYLVMYDDLEGRKRSLRVMVE
ncbi:T9SS type A sorting domain-containing protein [Dyadobacter sandarakinus]|uniref:T9SS type A sorting domain-containing protein n=1 Tax=Dyadobacter sandarakinus TaxID=2747268 RepID=A0ABX7IF67_9BACT|nr:T9SS type A sorting domain-containing protein [Dyadobacter sandarakinus]QRR03516.1 T9SS type A sorting domain-containing protein [Dyadobacter sandarakinus]